VTERTAGNNPNLTWTPKGSEIAREAGARLREFFAEGVETEYKGDVDLVTVADRTVEKLIRTAILLCCVMPEPMRSTRLRWRGSG